MASHNRKNLFCINELNVENFRGYRSISLEFGESFTLLLGENGAGKTAMLEALAVAAGSIFLGFPGVQSRSIRPEDVRHELSDYEGALVRRQQWPVRITARGSVGGETNTEWVRSLNGPNGRTTRQEANRIEELSLNWAEQLQRGGSPVPLPVIAYYGTQRLWLRKKTTEAQRGIGARLDGYIGCLEPASNHRQLEEWMYKQTLIELQQKKRPPQLDAVEVAVCRCLGGLRRFWFDVSGQSLQIEWENGLIQSFDSLSDGYRNMVAMVADIAWRAAVLNPQFARDAAERIEGIVLVDEIDLHLHPAWQQRVVKDLRRAFPNVQFVATTHSPQVVASVSKSEVRLLHENQVAWSEAYVEGRDSNSLLEDIFGVPSRPIGPETELIETLFRNIDDMNYDDARSALSRLEEVVGPHDPEVIRARWLIDAETAMVDEVEHEDGDVEL